MTLQHKITRAASSRFCKGNEYGAKVSPGMVFSVVGQVPVTGKITKGDMQKIKKLPRVTPEESGNLFLDYLPD